MSGSEDRGRSETLVANERVKAISGVVMNLATALLVAAIARVYVNGGPDGTAALWLLAVILLILIGPRLLHLLDGED